MVLRAKVDDELGAAVKSIAASRFDGNLSMAVRRLIEVGLQASERYPSHVDAVLEVGLDGSERSDVQVFSRKPAQTAPLTAKARELTRQPPTGVAPGSKPHEIENLRCKNCGWSSHRCKTDPVCAA